MSTFIPGIDTDIIIGNPYLPGAPGGPQYNPGPGPARPPTPPLDPGDFAPDLGTILDALRDWWEQGANEPEEPPPEAPPEAPSGLVEIVYATAAAIPRVRGPAVSWPSPAPLLMASLAMLVDQWLTELLGPVPDVEEWLVQINQDAKLREKLVKQIEYALSPAFAHIAANQPLPKPASNPRPIPAGPTRTAEIIVVTAWRNPRTGPPPPKPGRPVPIPAHWPEYEREIEIAVPLPAFVPPPPKEPPPAPPGRPPLYRVPPRRNWWRPRQPQVDDTPPNYRKMWYPYDPGWYIYAESTVRPGPTSMGDFNYWWRPRERWFDELGRMLDDALDRILPFDWDAFIEVSMLPSVSPGGLRIKLKEKAQRLAKGARAKGETTLRKDTKMRHQRAYMALLAFINKTYGRASEVVDVIEAFQRSLVNKDGSTYQWQGYEKFYDDWRNHLVDMHPDRFMEELVYDQLMDALVGQLGEAEKRAMLKAFGPGHWVNNIVGLPSTWLHRLGVDVYDPVIDTAREGFREGTRYVRSLW